jgi:hypothetical protein
VGVGFGGGRHWFESTYNTHVNTTAIHTSRIPAYSLPSLKNCKKIAKKENRKKVQKKD